MGRRRDQEFEPHWTPQHRVLMAANKRQQRRHAARRALKRGAVLVSLLGVTAVVLGLQGDGPLARNLKLGGGLDTARVAANTSTSTSTSELGVTTTTGLTLSRRQYVPGDCVDWDETLGGSSPESRITKVVPCDQPHVLEITAGFNLPALAAFPAPADWAALLASGQCRDAAAAYMGSPINPSGRFRVGAIKPTEASWKQGGRQVWCGLGDQTTSLEPGGGRPKKTSAARGDDQTLLPALGTCRSRDGARAVDVDCASPHDFEVTGEADLSAVIDHFPREDEWLAVAGERCRQVSTAYLGRAPVRPFQSGYLRISEESWAAGQRRLACTVSQFGPEGEPIASSGRLGSAG